MGRLKVISEEIANRIIDSVQDICEYDINFINDDGIIFASSRKDRIGQFHEVGYKAFQEKKTFKVYEKGKDFVESGINFPIYYFDDLICVIGITGDPNVVSKYVQLVEKITNLILLERRNADSSRSYEAKMGYLLRVLVSESKDYNYLETELKKLKWNFDSEKRVMIIQGERCLQYLEALKSENHALIYAYQYPDKVTLIIDSNSLKFSAEIFKKLTHYNNLRIAVGESAHTFNLHTSYEQASIMMTYQKEAGILEYNEGSLDVLIQSIPEDIQKMYVEKNLKYLEQEERDLLLTYFHENKSLEAVSKKIFIHKNTIQYRLNRIHEKTGLNPRLFDESAQLYFALLLDMK